MQNLTVISFFSLVLLCFVALTSAGPVQNVSSPSNGTLGAPVVVPVGGGAEVVRREGRGLFGLYGLGLGYGYGYGYGYPYGYYGYPYGYLWG